MERYEIVKDLGFGNFGVAKLVRDKWTREQFAVKFIERGQKVLLTPTHLAIVMEYAAGGELFQRICDAGRFNEDEEICHRDLKLENTLLDGSAAPRVKICDFGYSKSAVFHSQPKSTVGTPAYIAPEVLSKREYDGKRILDVHYSIPDHVRISIECRQLLSRIFVANPEKEARKPSEGLTIGDRFMGGSMDLVDDLDDDADIEDIGASGEFVCPFRALYDKRLADMVLERSFKGYVFKIMGGCDKQGFPMKQGVLTTGRPRLLLQRGGINILLSGRRSVKLLRYRDWFTPLTLQRKRAKIAEKKRRIVKPKDRGH
ncbi:hypothetical protein RHMOL_Rhmol07G0262200 [Rhododendron molle]|uniref:Uncharacterized protein n=1 Tax=Rhododendron molle TaxID=49168 RepID=A0ACC0N5Y7_RHOML|nr:hypothetical protein RHMOL_Rhmol07G0262200 [Rhododendron molle]